MKILLMEDDPVLSDIILDFLQEHYETDHAYNSDAAVALIEQHHYDLYVLDINVPGQNGIDLLHDLRQFHDTTPTIFITAYKDTHHLKKAFTNGAHDYIKKPFELEELHLRIENIKKVLGLSEDETIQIDPQISLFVKRKEIEKEGKKISLGQKNTALLHYFLQHKNRVISNNELTQNIWDYDTIPSDATLRSHIRDLREIIGKERIKTVRGEGYIYE